MKDFLEALRTLVESKPFIVIFCIVALINFIACIFSPSLGKLFWIVFDTWIIWSHPITGPEVAKLVSHIKTKTNEVKKVIFQ